MDWEKRSTCILRVPEPHSCFMGVMRRGGERTLEEIRAEGQYPPAVVSCRFFSAYSGASVGRTTCPRAGTY